MDNVESYFVHHLHLVDNVDEFRAFLDSQYHRWISEVVTNQRGPWDEVHFIGQGCKHCIINNEYEGEGEIIRCCQCEVSFHLSCLNPPMEKPVEQWVCGFCKGYPSQELWSLESTIRKAISGTANTNSNTNDAFEIDSSIQTPHLYNPVVTGYLPLHSVFGNVHNGQYDYLLLHNARVISPVFFGYELTPNLPQVKLIDQPLSIRLRKLAILLSSTDPKDMDIDTRLTLVSTLFDIARDIPSVLVYITETQEEADSLSRNVQQLKSSQISIFRSIVNQVSKSY